MRYTGSDSFVRLYRPPSSDDASHDEALSDRITALNKLDLSLDHLGVDAGESKDDVYRIVEACGQSKSGGDIMIACLRVTSSFSYFAA